MHNSRVRLTTGSDGASSSCRHPGPSRRGAQRQGRARAVAWSAACLVCWPTSRVLAKLRPECACDAPEHARHTSRVGFHIGKTVMQPEIAAHARPAHGHDHAHHSARACGFANESWRTAAFPCMPKLECTHVAARPCFSPGRSASLQYTGRRRDGKDGAVASGESLCTSSRACRRAGLHDA